MLLLDANVCIDAYAGLRAHVRAHGSAIGANDLTSTSIALTHGLGLVSDDRAAFARVPRLTPVTMRDVRGRCRAARRIVSV